MVDDLLDISRITQGKIWLRKEEVDVGAVASRAVDATRHLTEQRRHAVAVTLPTTPVLVLADPLRLEQVLVNLLGNAAKYTPCGGRITLSVVPSDEAVEVRVRDTGVGIPPELLQRVLVVDDNVDAAEILAEVLREEGHDTRLAFDGASGLRLAGELRPHLVLLDLGLPEMDGFEVARRLRAARTEAQLIALSGYGQPRDRELTAAAGFTGHLVKPISVEDLLRTLREVQAAARWEGGQLGWRRGGPDRK